MCKVTIFTAPKYFKPPFAMLQYNAIKSWLSLNPVPEIILCGNDYGIAEVAKELEIKHISDIECSDKGTPLVSSMFSRIQTTTKNDILTYVNSDIIFTDTFLDALNIVDSAISHFVIVGQRWDLDVKTYIDFTDNSWDCKILSEVKCKGKLHAPCGIDYFIFRKGLGLNMPPFIVGRPSWDNWLLNYAHIVGYEVVDATEKILAIHQNHDYSHIGGFKQAREGKEAQLNNNWAKRKFAFIDSAHWKFSKEKLVRC